MNDNDLQNIENYNKMLKDNEYEIYLKYSNIIIQYLLLGIEKIKNHNPEYVKYILIKGIFTISYVFKMLLVYTCNLQLTYHQCQKSYSYYTEFIGQIGDDSVTYLQLNSKDAALFVYKKTIFDISGEIKKKYIETDINEKKNKTVSVMIDIYNKLLETEITLLNSEQLKNTEFIDQIYTNIGRINSKLCKLYYSCEYVSGNCNDTIINEICNNAINMNENDSNNSKNGNNGNNSNNKNVIIKHDNDIFFKKIVYVKRFCDIIILKKTSISCGDSGHDNYKDYIKMIEYFIKKIRKINNLPSTFEMHLISKSFSDDFEEKIKLYNTSKFINWLFIL